MMQNAAKNNTDRELWRKVSGDYYAPSIHVTESGGIGIDCGGHVIKLFPPQTAGLQPQR